MCGCMGVYPYICRLNQRALLDQHLHCFHVPDVTRRKQRCITVLPSQRASVRRSGAAAATQATVHVRACVCQCIVVCETEQDHVRV
jgi:hypothetical protein